MELTTVIDLCLFLHVHTLKNIVFHYCKSAFVHIHAPYCAFVIKDGLGLLLQLVLHFTFILIPFHRTICMDVTNVVKWMLSHYTMLKHKHLPFNPMNVCNKDQNSIKSCFLSSLKVLLIYIKWKFIFKKVRIINIGLKMVIFMNF